MLTTSPRGRRKPLYEQIAEKVRREIRQGGPRNRRLPTQMQLCEKHGVSRITVRQAMDLLAAEGLIERIPGRGTFVTASPPQDTEDATGLLVATNLGSHLSSGRYMHDLLGGATEFLEERGVHLIIKKRRPIEGVSDEFIADMFRGGVHGLLGHCVGEKFARTLARAAVRGHMPTVLLNTRLDDVPLDYVTCDNILGGAMIADYLGRLGHRRVAFLVDSKPALADDISQKDRWSGLVRSMEDRDGHAICFATWQAEPVPPMERLLANPRAVSAVCCGTDSLAARLISRLLALGINVPGDMSVVGYDNNADICEHAAVPITTVAQPAQDMGARAAQFLWERITGHEPPLPRRSQIAPRLVLRASAAAPARKGT